MKKISLMLVMIVVCISCVMGSVLASSIPEKVDPDSTAKATEKATTKPTEKPTEKATTKPTEKPTEKATTKPTAKPTEKATTKPTTKATEKATTKPTTKPTETEKDEPKETDDNEKIVLSSSEEDEDLLFVETTKEPTLNIESTNSEMNNKKYITNFAAFMWFLLGVVVSAVISLFISYRFYLLKQTDASLIAEVRTLKRDIDKKMVGTVSGFTEHDYKVTNSNQNYAREKSSLSPKRSIDENGENGIYKKWESQINTSQTTNEVNEINQKQQRAISQQRAREKYSVNNERRKPPKKQEEKKQNKFKNALSGMFPFDKND